MSGNAHFFIAMVFFVILVGLILRYGRSSNSILNDANSILNTLTLQNKGAAYYGP